MKMKTIEEKAKRYDEALNRCREFYETLGNAKLKKEVEEIFPELKESEDERIRKELLAFCKNRAEKYPNDPKYKNISAWIAWLEKQGEKDEEILILKDQIESLHAAIKAVKETHRIELEKQGEQKLYVNDNAKEMFIKALERVEEQNAKGYKLTDCDKNSWWEDFKEYTTSEQILANSAKTCEDEQKPADVRTTWYWHVEDVKQEWSEEDERIYKVVLELMDSYSKGTIGGCIISPNTDRYIKWLKSIKDRVQVQSQWKPSDEQMKILNEVLNFAANHESAHWNDYIFGTLNNLIRQLKKLRNE